MILRIVKPAVDEAKSIAKVGVWVVASSVVAVLVSYLAHNAKLVDLMPVINIVAVAGSKFFQKEENAAIAELPVAQQAPVAAEAAKIGAEVVARGEEQPAATPIQGMPPQNIPYGG